MAGQKNDRKKQSLRASERDMLPVQNRIKLNPTVILFAFVFVFLIVCILRLVFRETTGYYEVMPGNNGKVSSYTAFITRDEMVYRTDRAGFIHYLAGNGDRVRVGQAVCTIDENGDFTSQLLSAYSQEKSMDDESLAKIKNAMRSFAISFDPDNYSSIYDEKIILENQVFGFLNDDIITNAGNATDMYTFNVKETKKSGIFVCGYDGYEKFDPDDFKMSDLDVTDLEFKRIKNAQRIESGEPIYKLVLKDSFSIIFQMTEEDVVRYWEADKLKVYFPDIDKELVGHFSFTYASDDPNTRLVRIDFDECGYMLADVRTARIEINSSVVSGFKIPKTSLTTKDYYVVPASYLTVGGNNNTDAVSVTKGLNLQVYENGTISVRFTPITGYKTFDDYILVDTSSFKIGDILIEPETSKTYEIGAQKSLQGVYNVNKGYAVFKSVNILDDMDNGFVIIEKTGSGVSIYDHIALNANLIKEGELIY
jgi:hypothetical protein